MHCQTYFASELVLLLFVLLGSYEGGWTAHYRDTGQFFQIDLGNVTMVTAIATQGHSVNAWWVKKYTLDYANEDGNFTAYNNSEASTSRSILMLHVQVNVLNFVQE